MMLIAATLVLMQFKGPGLECLSVTPGGVIDKARIRKGDVMLAFDGVPVKTREDLRFAVWNCLKKGSVPVTLRHGTVLVNAGELGEWPKDDGKLGARFEPQISRDLKAARDTAWEAYDKKEFARAIVLFRDLSKKCLESEDWINFARCRAMAAYADASHKPGVIRWTGGVIGPTGYLRGAVEARVTDIEEAFTKAKASGEQSVLRTLWWAQFSVGAGTAGDGENRELEDTFMMCLSSLTSSIDEENWDVARAALHLKAYDPTQAFGRERENALNSARAGRTLAQYEGAWESRALMHYHAAYDSEGFDAAFSIEQANKAIECAEKANSPYYIAMGWMMRGLVGSFRGRSSDAEESYKKAISICEKNDNLGKSLEGRGFQRIALSRLAVLSARKYQFDESIVLLDRAERIKLESDLLSFWAYASVDLPHLVRARLFAEWDRTDESKQLVDARQGNIALHHRVGDAGAERLVALALVGGKLSPEVADSIKRRSNSSRVEIGLALGRAQMIIDARAHREKEVREGSVRLKNSTDQISPTSYDRAALAMATALAIQEIGSPLEQSSAWKNALNLYRLEALTAVGESGREYAGSLLSKAGSGLVACEVRAAHSVEALRAFEESRAASLLLAMADRDAPVWRQYLGAMRALDDAELRRADAQSTIASIEISLKDKSLPQDERNILTERKTQAEKDKLKAEEDAGAARPAVDAAYKAAQSASRVTSVAPDDARARLPKDLAFIGFSQAEKGISVIAVRAGMAPISAFVPMDAKTLMTKVTEFRRLVADRQSSIKTISTKGAALAALLFPKAIQTYIGTCPRWAISPDGVLWELPFAALTYGPAKSADFLGATRSLQYSQSLGLLTSDLGGKSSAKGVLVVGDPSFSGEPSGERSTFWGDRKPPSQLPATAMEAKTVAALYKSSPLLGKDATEAQVRSQIGSARIIHFATHGFLNPKVPTASGILLTPNPSAPGRGDDGALQALEIVRDLKLDADIVILSACETARGRYLQGEGVIGLSRALQVAGARTIVASQWKVADQATADLMVAFHKQFAKNGLADVSMKSALAESRAKYKHPYYWSAFSVIGRAGKG